MNVLDRMAVLEVRVAELEARLVQLEQQPPPTRPQPSGRSRSQWEPHPDRAWYQDPSDWFALTPIPSSGPGDHPVVRKTAGKARVYHYTWTSRPERPICGLGYEMDTTAVATEADLTCHYCKQLGKPTFVGKP